MLRRTAFALALLVGLAVLPMTAAGAAARSLGGVRTATQTGSALHLTGWAYDGSVPQRSIEVSFWSAGSWLGHTRASRTSPVVNKIHHVRGRHRFAVTLDVGRTVTSVIVRTADAHRTAIAVVRVVARTPSGSPAARVLSVARSYVGHARYTYGGATPRTGFDCSGYTQWVYAQAHAARLPRTAEAQRHYARRVSAADARPGDLVFYVSGGSAYHVAIYAGHHMQYAAATPRDGIRYQAVWSSAVTYGRVL